MLGVISVFVHHWLLSDLLDTAGGFTRAFQLVYVHLWYTIYLPAKFKDTFSRQVSIIWLV